MKKASPPRHLILLQTLFCIFMACEIREFPYFLWLLKNIFQFLNPIYFNVKGSTILIPLALLPFFFPFPFFPLKQKETSPSHTQTKQTPNRASKPWERWWGSQNHILRQPRWVSAERVKQVGRTGWDHRAEMRQLKTLIWRISVSRGRCEIEFSLFCIVRQCMNLWGSIPFSPPLFGPTGR